MLQSTDISELNGVGWELHSLYRYGLERWLNRLYSAHEHQKNVKVH